MKKNLTFLLTLFLAACLAALFLSLIVFQVVYPHTIKPSASVSKASEKLEIDYYGVGMYPAPTEQTELKFTQTPNLAFALKAKERPLKLLFFGDIMLDRHVKEKINRNGFSYLLEKFNLPAEWQAPDIQMANLEGAVTAGGRHYPPEISIDFAFNPDDMGQLKNYGFNFFTIANNHILDQGQIGFTETQKNLENLGFNYVGCPDRQTGECNIKILDIRDITIATLGYSMVYGVLDEEKMLAQIIAAKTQADLTVVFMHWGVEYEQASRKNQQTLAHKIIDAGADVLIGSHPHVVQEMEIYKSKPIFYSLGNFIFDQYFSRETQEGLGVGITVDNDKMEITLLPFKSKVSQIELMAGEERDRWLKWFSESSKGVKGIEEGIVKIYWFISRNYEY